MDDEFADALSYPKIDPAYVPVIVDENHVRVRVGPWDESSFSIHDRDGDGAVATLFRSLNGENALEDVLNRFDPSKRDGILALLKKLHARGLVVDASRRDARAPQQAWGHVSTVDDPDGGRMTDERFERIRSQSVAIVHHGAAGEYVRGDLDQVGLETVENVEVDSLDDGRRTAVTEAIESADVAVYLSASPFPDLAAHVNDVAHEADTPWIAGEVRGTDACIGPFVLPGETACYRCFTERCVQNASDGEPLERYLRQAAEWQDEDSTPYSPAYARVLSGFVYNDLLNYMGSGHAVTAGRMLHIDLVGFTTEVNELVRVPRCPVCGQPEAESVPRDRFTTVETIARGDRGE